MTRARGLLLALVLAVAGQGATAETCSPDSVIVTTPSGGAARFSVEIADDAQERARGLMFRESLPASHGMLFVYPNERPLAFWMRNTLIPLDMIFVDAQGVVVNVHANAVPHDETSIPSTGPALAVLEIGGGLAGALGIVAGATLRHPAFGPLAADPCSD